MEEWKMELDGMCIYSNKFVQQNVNCRDSGWTNPKKNNLLELTSNMIRKTTTEDIQRSIR